MYAYLFVLACVCRPVCMCGGQKLMISLSLSKPEACQFGLQWVTGGPWEPLHASTAATDSFNNSQLLCAAGKPHSYLHVVQQALDSLSCFSVCLFVCLSTSTPRLANLYNLWIFSEAISKLLINRLDFWKKREVWKAFYKTTPPLFWGLCYQCSLQSPKPNSSCGAPTLLTFVSLFANKCWDLLTQFH